MITTYFGTEYTIGSIFQALYEAAGTSIDWAKGVTAIPYSYTIELQDQGHYGFLLPPSYIEPQGSEIWAALQLLSEEVYAKMNGDNVGP